MVNDNNASDADASVNDLGALVAQALRAEMDTGRLEEDLVLVTPPDFDPVKKIASVFERTKTVSLLRYFNDANFMKIMWPDGPDESYYSTLRSLLYGRPRRSGESEEEQSLKRPFYEAADFSLFEYLGAGLLALNPSGKILLTIIAKSESVEEAIEKIALMRIRQTYIFAREAFGNPEPEPFTFFGRSRPGMRRTRNSESDEWSTESVPTKKWLEAEVAEARKPVAELADSVAMVLYGKFFVWFYHTNFGIQATPSLGRNSFTVKPRGEAYQDPLRGQVPLDPNAVMAAHAYYNHFRGLGPRLARVSSIFDLVVLAAVQFYKQRIADPALRQHVQQRLDSPVQISSVLDDAVISYHLSKMREK